MTLQEIIDFLALRTSTIVVPLGFNRPHSYRGDYAELAFEPCRNVTVGEMLSCALAARGTTFIGYKGGEFRMNAGTECYLANYGCCGESIGPVLLGYMVGEHRQNEITHTITMKIDASDAAAQIEKLRASLREAVPVMLFSGATK